MKGSPVEGNILYSISGQGEHVHLKPKIERDSNQPPDLWTPDGELAVGEGSDVSKWVQKPSGASLGLYSHRQPLASAMPANL